MARRIRLTTRDRTSRVDRLAAGQEEGGEGLGGTPGTRVCPPRTPLTFAAQWVAVIEATRGDI